MPAPLYRGMMDVQAGAPLALVVEDEALLALEMEDLLINEGFDTLIVGSAAGMATVSAAAITVAVVNLRLNGQLVGYGIIQDLRRQCPNLPVVVVTGYDADAPQANLRGLGWPTVRLQKPQHGDRLIPAVRDVLRQASQGLRPVGGRREVDRAAGA
ncbi:DNA-binding transcriptional response regulator [Roseicella frigidaeris]|nr:response regulator [Roseicella frigidaeris]